jgi:hypothetical protein
MDIYRFSSALAHAISEEIPSADLKNEAEFERNHVIEPAWLLSQRHPEIRVFVHPERSKKKCVGGCDAGVSDPSRRVRGCPDCWARSKEWSVVEALGTRNNFDMVALDHSNKSLAVEVKWLSLSGGRGPNSEFQRFIGQCVLAAARNDVVLGVCGLRGARKKEFDSHRSRLEATLKKIGVRLVPVYAK